MNRIEFEEKYRKKGGMAMLAEFIQQETPLEYIGKHFGVTKQAVRLWCLEILGIEYDPRENRKWKIINSMVKFAERHKEEEFREVYYYISKHYYDIALAECYTRGIYGQK